MAGVIHKGDVAVGNARAVDTRRLGRHQRIFCAKEHQGGARNLLEPAFGLGIVPPAREPLHQRLLLGNAGGVNGR
jgi:hypothetical protein